MKLVYKKIEKMSCLIMTILLFGASTAVDSNNWSPFIPANNNWIILQTSAHHAKATPTSSRLYRTQHNHRTPINYYAYNFSSSPEASKPPSAMESHVWSLNSEIPAKDSLSRRNLIKATSNAVVGNESKEESETSLKEILSPLETALENVRQFCDVARNFLHTMEEDDDEGK